MVTKYDGRTTAVNVATNVTLNLMPAIADATLKKALLTEWEAGTTFECNIREFSPSGSVNTREEQFLCDADVMESAGATKWSIDPIVIQTGNPQTANTFLDSLVVGSKFFLGRRAGLPYSTAAAAAQRISLWQVEVSLVEDMPDVANADGNKFETRVHLAVKKHERNATISAT